jgi:hypothetical protein
MRFSCHGDGSPHVARSGLKWSSSQGVQKAWPALSGKTVPKGNAAGWCEKSRTWPFRAASGVATAVSEVLWEALRGRGRVVFGVEHGLRRDVDTLSVSSPIWSLKLRRLHCKTALGAVVGQCEGRHVAAATDQDAVYSPALFGQALRPLSAAKCVCV